MVLPVRCKEYLTMINFKQLAFSRESTEHFDVQIAFLRHYIQEL